MPNRAELCQHFCAHVAMLERYLVRRLNGSPDVEDVAQETFLRLTQVSNLSRIENPRAFLLTTAQNVLRDRYRRFSARSGQNHVGLDDVELVSDAVPADQLVEARERLRFFEDAVYTLPEDQRRAFLLFHFGERSQSEIAAEMSCSVSLVEKLVRGARQGVQQRLAKLERGRPLPISA